MLDDSEYGSLEDRWPSELREKLISCVNEKAALDVLEDEGVLVKLDNGESGQAALGQPPYQIVLNYLDIGNGGVTKALLWARSSVAMKLFLMDMLFDELDRPAYCLAYVSKVVNKTMSNSGAYEVANLFLRQCASVMEAMEADLHAHVERARLGLEALTSRLLTDSEVSLILHVKVFLTYSQTH